MNNYVIWFYNYHTLTYVQYTHYTARWGIQSYAMECHGENDVKGNGATENCGKVNGAKVNGATGRGAKENGATGYDATGNGAKLNGAQGNSAMENGATRT